MRITITGDLGSGKSTVAKKISTEMSFEYISSGAIFRLLAQESGVDVLTFNKLALTDKSIDDKVDSKISEYNNYNGNIIIDSRLAWHFVEKAYNFYFEVDAMEAARRIFNDKVRTCEKGYSDVMNAYADMKNRKETENIRYKERYGIDCYDMTNYDVVINTTNISVDSICKVFVAILNRLENHEYVAKYWISPTLLLPTDNIKVLGCSNAVKLRSDVQQNGFSYDEAIKCVKVDGRYYIWDGHKRCSAAILNKIPLIPVEVIAIDEQLIHKGHTAQMFVENNIDPKRYSDWEDMHSFEIINNR